MIEWIKVERGRVPKRECLLIYDENGWIRLENTFPVYGRSFYQYWLASGGAARILYYAFVEQPEGYELHHPNEDD